MKIKIIFLLFMTASISAKSEELLTFNLDYCIDSSSHIFQAKILNEKGWLEINQVFHGEIKVKNILLPDLAEIKKNLADYVPSDDLSNWEIMVFLKKMNSSSETFVPAFDLSNSSFDLAISIFWIKNNRVHFSWQPSNPGPAIFSDQGEITKYRKIIKEYIEIKTKIGKIKNKKRCKKKFRQFSKLFSHYKYNYKVYEAIFNSDCKQNILPFLEAHLPTDSFHFIHSQIIDDYVKFGKEKKATEIDAIFKSEFTFWKNSILTNPNKKWWRGSDENRKRFYFFCRLTKSILRYEVGNWQEYTNQVLDLFSSQEKYQVSEGSMTINQQILQIQKEKENY